MDRYARLMVMAALLPWTPAAASPIFGDGFEPLPPNAPPQVQGSLAFAATEDSTLLVAAPGLLAGASDPDGDPLQVRTTPLRPPQHGTLQLAADGSFSYQPADAYNGADSFRVAVADPRGATAEREVSLEVAAVDDPPVAVDDAVEVVDGAGTSLVDVLANDSDADGGPRLVTAVSQPEYGAASIAADGLAVSYTPDPAYYTTDAPDVFTYTLAGGSSASVAVSVVVPRAATGDLLVSEIMHSPSAGTTDYLELRNVGGRRIDLRGLGVHVENAAGQVMVHALADDAMPRVLAAGAAFVLAADGDATSNGGVPVDEVVPALSLEGVGSVGLGTGDGGVALLPWDDRFPQSPGRAMSLARPIDAPPASAAPWYWCDAEAPLPGGDFGTPGTANGWCGFAVAAPVDFCNIQYPQTVPGTVPPSTPITVYGRLYEPWATDRNTEGNDGYPHLQSQLGHGPEGWHPAQWSWQPAAFNDAYSGIGSDDELSAVLSIAAAGSWHYGFRHRLRDPASGAWSDWTYCDQDGAVAEPQLGRYGRVVVAD